MKITCGVFIINSEDKILIGHPYGFPDHIFSIPKGEPDRDDNSYLETAVREVLEETGINLFGISLIGGIDRVGEFIYTTKKKTLIAFKARIHGTIDIKKLYCDSMVAKEIFGIEVPEIDDFLWATKTEAMKLIHQTQREALKLITLKT